MTAAIDAVAGYDAPYLAAIAQSSEEADRLVVLAAEDWQQTAALFADVTVSLAHAIGNMSIIYNASSVDAALFQNATAVGGDCPVESRQQYYANQTASLVFACCHARKLRAPGLLLTYNQMCAAYLPGCAGMPDPTAEIVRYIQQTQSLATIGIIAASCLDDTSIVVPQRATAQAIAASRVAALLLQAYLDLISNVNTLFVCTAGLSPRCATTGPLSVAQAVPPDAAFPAVAFDAVCGQASLEAFDDSRFTTPCAQQQIPL